MHNFDISAIEYRDHKFVIGTDCERVLDAGFTGINTRAGDLMTVKEEILMLTSPTAYRSSSTPIKSWRSETQE